MNVGIIGLGVMGSAVAGHLLEAGHSVRGFDVDAARVASLAQMGGTPEQATRAVAAKSDVVLLWLPSVATLDQVATELAAGPTFAGYPCSPTVSENGLPTWLIVDGKQAQRREKQGDVWYSVKLQDGSYEQVLRIPKGETAPPVMGLSQ